MSPFSYRQFFSLVMLTMPIAGHFLLVSPIIHLVNKDAWVTDFIEILSTTFGKSIRKLILAFISLYGVYILVITLYGLLKFTQLIYLRDYNLIYIESSLYLIIIYSILVGIESIARASEPLLLLIGFIGSLFGSTTFIYKDYSRLFPVFQDSIFPILKGISVCLALIGEMMILFIFKLQTHLRKQKWFLLLLISMAFFILFTFFGTITGCIAIFGIESSKSKLFPSYDILKLVHLDFVNRLDIYGLFALIVGGVIRIAMWHIAVCEVITALFNRAKKLWFHLFMILLISWLVLYVIPNVVDYEARWLMLYYPLMGMISIGIPVLTWLVSEFQYKRKHLLR
jgi:spore germination protein KB